MIRWCSEYLFVFGALILLKYALFPLVLWWWFSSSDRVGTLQEATSLIMSVISIVILFGLGSISRYREGLTLRQTLVASTIINLPFFILWLFPAVSSWAELWWGPIGDGLQLWVPALSAFKGMLFPVVVAIVLLGRRIYVREQTETTRQSKLPARS